MKDEFYNACECWFLDVGQGTSNVILLGGGRAIVIDCGPKSSTETLELLDRYVDTIEVLVISHNDSDHDGNVQRILNQYRKAVNAIYFLKDRTPSSNITTFALLESPEYKNDFPRPKRLEGNQTIFSGDNLNLAVLYPSFVDNLELDGHPNSTSGILRLTCDNRKVVYSGDAGLKAWESLSQQASQKPLTCDIMTIPHHGGKLADKNRLSDHYTIYSEIIKPTYGIISVGSSNQHKHPLPDSVNSLKELDVEVLCSQMTTNCCKKLELIRQTSRSILPPSRSSNIEDKTRQGNSRNVACFGSVALEISKDDIRISGMSMFNKAFQKFYSIPSFAPMCEGLRRRKA
jgi:competence protein ComEC